MWDELLWELCYLVHTMDRFPHLFRLPSEVKEYPTVTEIHGVSQEVKLNTCCLHSLYMIEIFQFK